MAMLTMEEALNFMDTHPDTWKEYRVGCTERKEQKFAAALERGDWAEVKRLDPLF